MEQYFFSRIRDASLFLKAAKNKETSTSKDIFVYHEKVQEAIADAQKEFDRLVARAVNIKY